MQKTICWGKYQRVPDFSPYKTENKFTTVHKVLQKRDPVFRAEAMCTQITSFFVFFASELRVKPPDSVPKWDFGGTAQASVSKPPFSPCWRLRQALLNSEILNAHMYRLRLIFLWAHPSWRRLSGIKHGCLFSRTLSQKRSLFFSTHSKDSFSSVRSDCKWQAVHRNQTFMSLSSLINCCYCRWQRRDNNRDPLNSWLEDVGVYDIQKCLSRSDRWKACSEAIYPGERI